MPKKEQTYLKLIIEKKRLEKIKIALENTIVLSTIGFVSITPIVNLLPIAVTTSVVGMTSYIITDSLLEKNKIKTKTYQLKNNIEKE